MDFRVGDTVRLKSGGPLMTVEQIGTRHPTGEESVWCVWLEEVEPKQQAKLETFSPSTLEQASLNHFGSMLSRT